MDKTEKRFDVRVPCSNTVLLDMLTEESKITGIVESRLLVQYATRYAQLQRQGVPSVVMSTVPSMMNGQGEGQAFMELPAQPAMDSDGLDTMYGDPD